MNDDATETTAASESSKNATGPVSWMPDVRSSVPVVPANAPEPLICPAHATKPLPLAGRSDGQPLTVAAMASLRDPGTRVPLRPSGKRCSKMTVDAYARTEVSNAAEPAVHAIDVAAYAP